MSSVIILLMSVRNISLHSSNIPLGTGGQVVVPAVSKIAAPISGFLEVIVGSNSLKYGVLLLSTSTSAVAFTTQKLTSFEP